MLQHCCCCCYTTGLLSHTDVEKVINMPVTACRGKSTHARMQAGRQSPDSYIISSWSFLPASTRKRVVGPLRTAPCHSAPAGQTGKYRKNIFQGTVTHGQCCLPRRYMESAEWERKRKSVYWLVEISRGQPHLLLLVVVTTSLGKGH